MVERAVQFGFPLDLKRFLMTGIDVDRHKVIFHTPLETNSNASELFYFSVFRK